MAGRSFAYAPGGTGGKHLNEQLISTPEYGAEIAKELKYLRDTVTIAMQFTGIEDPKESIKMAAEMVVRPEDIFLLTAEEGTRRNQAEDMVILSIEHRSPLLISGPVQERIRAVLGPSSKARRFLQLF